MGSRATSPGPGNIPCQHSGVPTCEVHLLAFREHLVAAHTPGTGRVVVLPSCLQGERALSKAGHSGSRSSRNSPSLAGLGLDWKPKTRG